MTKVLGFLCVRLAVTIEVRVFFAVVSSVALACPAISQADTLIPLEDAMAYYWLEVTPIVGLPGTQVEDLDTRSLHKSISSTGVTPEGGQHHVSAEATAKLYEYNAKVEVKTSAKMDPAPPNDDSRSRAMAMADVGYFFRIAMKLVAIPPMPVQRAPVIMRAFLGSEGSGDWTGNAALLVSGLEIDYLVEAGNTPPMEPIVHVFWKARPHVKAIYAVGLYADCDAWAHYWTSLIESECSSMADPIFEFDQETFDEIMGEDTFPLEDFYAFEFSPNLVSPMPMPAIMLLLDNAK
jgi:hypothetical protein